MSFLPSSAPWGSPTVGSIPLPPFLTPEHHVRHLRMLQLHVAMLDVGGPALPSLALGATLEPEIEQARRAHDSSEWLSPLAFQIGLDTWFPAPWTPESLARALVRQSGPHVQHAPDRLPGHPGEGWRWGFDPEFTATRGAGGGWTIRRHERGSVTSQEVRDDRDLVVLWIDHHRTRFVFPLAHAFDEADLEALAPSSAAVLRADVTDAQMPYRTNWVARRDELRERPTGSPS